MHKSEKYNILGKMLNLNRIFFNFQQNNYMKQAEILAFRNDIENNFSNEIDKPKYFTEVS